MRSIYIESDNLITLGPLSDTDGDVVTTATVTYSLYDGETALAEDVAMTHTSGGVYTAILEDTIELEANQRYELVIVADLAGTKLTKRMAVMAVWDQS